MSLPLRGLLATVLVCLAAGALPGARPFAAERPPAGQEAALQRALNALVERPDGPPGVIVEIQRGRKRQVFTAGLAAVSCEAAGSRRCRIVRPPRPTDAMRIASVSKTFSGATSLALVTDGALSLDDTIGGVLPDLPAQWHAVTLRQLLNHTSGMPDFAASQAFAVYVNQFPTKAPPPRTLLSFVETEPLEFTPGSMYRYSNSDNIVVGLMVEAASGQSYEQALDDIVFSPLGLDRTTLPRRVWLPNPHIHGYDVEPGGPVEDVSELVAFGGYAWASGGLVSTPADLGRYVRAYVGGELFGPAERAAQFTFRPGAKSSPPGPGRNAAGLALFRYETRCGTVFGHTGSILGYTQLIASSRNGRKTVTFSINTQAGEDLIPALRKAQVKAVCLALGK